MTRKTNQKMAQVSHQQEMRFRALVLKVQSNDRHTHGDLVNGHTEKVGTVE